MKRIILAILSSALGLAVLNQAGAQTRELGSSGDLLDGVAALVDDGIVLKSEVRDRMRVVAENFAVQQSQLPPEQRGQLPPVSILEQQVLDQLVMEQVLLQRAENIGITVGDDSLNQYLADVAANADLTLEQLPGWLASQGVDYFAFREDARRSLIIRQLERSEVVDRIRINPRELQQCLERASKSETRDFDYNISHILVGFSPDAEEEEIAAAEAKIRDIARQLDEGADFAEMAVAYSESSTALDGGLLGWRKGAELPTIFANDVMRMKVGEHSTPIRGNGGFHIVRLNDMRGSQPQLVDQVRARQIMLTPNEVLDDEATRQKLLGIRDQILNGDDFATVAAAVSEHAATAVDGGDLGWATLDQLPEFAAVLSTLEIGEISEPFRTRYGWHIFEVTDRRRYDMTDDVRESNCGNEIGNGKAVEETELWRRRLQAQAYIVKKL